MCGKTIVDRMDSKGKGPRAGMSLINPKNSERPVWLEMDRRIGKMPYEAG
jgi:hypothetical protein